MKIAFVVHHAGHIPHIGGSEDCRTYLVDVDVPKEVEDAHRAPSENLSYVTIYPVVE